VFGLSRLGDHSYGAGRDFRFLATRSAKRV
jgi:hypothetical protein